MFQIIILIICCLSSITTYSIDNSIVINKKAIVIGATSGMGREVAKRLCLQGYTLGLVGRRVQLLQSLQNELAGPSIINPIDVTETNAREQLLELISQLEGLDLIVISVTAYLDNRYDSENAEVNFQPQKAWKEKERTINVDFKGFIAMADLALDFFTKQNHGHIVGISSTSGLKGFASSPDYSAAKAGISTYMEAVRHQMVRDNINVQVTNVIPGFVAVEHSPLGEDPNAYWEITTQEAGEIIVNGILQKQKVIYVPGKVWLLNLLNILPDFIYQTFFNWM